MTVRAVIGYYRNLKYKIDGRLYEHQMYIPEIIRDRAVRMYGKLGDEMIIKTRETFTSIEECNDILRLDHGKNITVQVKSYIEDDGSTWYYYTSARYGDSDAYETLEAAYENANDYLNGLGELW